MTHNFDGKVCYYSLLVVFCSCGMHFHPVSLTAKGFIMSQPWKSCSPVFSLQNPSLPYSILRVVALSKWFFPKHPCSVPCLSPWVSVCLEHSDLLLSQLYFSCLSGVALCITSVVLWKQPALSSCLAFAISSGMREWMSALSASYK